jgi:hypothetical protein
MTTQTNLQTNLRTNRPFRASRYRSAIRLTAAAVMAGAAFGVATSGLFASPAAAECTPQSPPAACEPIDIDAMPLPQGPAVFEAGKLPGRIMPPVKEGIPDGAEKNPADPADPADDGGPIIAPVTDLDDLVVDVYDPSAPIDVIDPDVSSPGTVAPENTNQAGGDCTSITACPEVTVPPETTTTTTTTTTTVPVDVEGETEEPVGALAFTGSGDTLLRLGAVLAIGGVAAVASAAAARKRRY